MLDEAKESARPAVLIFDDIVEGVSAEVVTPPEPEMRTISLLDFWLFIIGRAAILKGIAEQTRFRGYVPRGMGLRSQARSRGFSNASAMHRHDAAQRAAQQAARPVSAEVSEVLPATAT